MDAHFLHRHHQSPLPPSPPLVVGEKLHRMREAAEGEGEGEGESYCHLCRVISVPVTEACIEKKVAKNSGDTSKSGNVLAPLRVKVSRDASDFGV